MASLIFNHFPYARAKGLIGDAEAANKFKMMLVTSSYTPNKDTHLDRADVTNEVAATGGYAAGGVVVACTLSKDTANDRIIYTFAPGTWTSSTITAAAAVIYLNTGTAADDILVLYNDFGGNVVTNNTTFSVAASTATDQN
jgi:hypothetical protein